ncbi:NAD-dependent epimerase/dehydratase family protein [Pararhizobium mangrovi]|uniref:NAD-dependent epimerase/dehydratase family protein n=1 Tax=Pararhizobium mangrovi TaxID=2590452 RepID=A0A506TXR5_9HYPH|nr:NAD-dependent epimerase/dehydratase family protein [Pararhizobium mangrovi]TPW25978.1 NAD-dependent epimerase/dehydratase family protein [Pararhizobium mangrovi]
MRWFITGGAGFIGVNLIEELLKENNNITQIVVFDNFSSFGLDEISKSPALKIAPVLRPEDELWTNPSHVVVIKGDVRDAQSIAMASNGADVLVHLAANTGVMPSVANPYYDCEVNVLGTLNCLEAARNNSISRFVLASSGAPAGICEPPITETIAPRPSSPYGASKLAGEAYCSAYFTSYGVDTVALRFSNVYGPQSILKGSVVATFIRQALAGQPITINGDGSQTRDFIYVKDLAEAIIRAARCPDVGGELFQIATGIETSVEELLAMLSGKYYARGIPATDVGRSARSPADVLRNFADPAKARSVLGWAARTPLSEGLDATIDWFIGEGNR